MSKIVSQFFCTEPGLDRELTIGRIFMHYAITGFVTMLLWYFSGSLSYTLIMLISYLLSVGILYITAKLIVRNVGYYESLACYNWAIVLFFIFVAIFGFLAFKSLDIDNVESYSDLVGAIGWFWITVFSLSPVIILVISIHFVIEASWLQSVAIAILSVAACYLFSAILEKLLGFAFSAILNS